MNTSTKLKLTLAETASQWERDWFEERAAILEFEAGLPREQAEFLARQEILEQRGFQPLHQTG